MAQDYADDKQVWEIRDGSHIFWYVAKCQRDAVLLFFDDPFNEGRDWREPHWDEKLSLEISWVPPGKRLTMWGEDGETVKTAADWASSYGQGHLMSTAGVW